MKHTSKFLAILLALCLVLSLGATAFASGEPSDEAPAAGVPVEEAYLEYLHEFLLAEQEINSNMTIEQVEDEFMPAFEAAAKTGDWLTNTVNGAPLDILFNGMLESGVAMTFEEFAAQYDGGAALSVEEAFIEYIHEWLIAENEINSNMTEEIMENEFMPLVREMNFVDFPAEMIYSGMLEQGVPMTFEEFAAQYGPAAAGGTDEAAYKAYLKEFVSAVPAVQGNLDEFIAAIDAGTYDAFPADMMFNAQWWGYAAMTYDEFVAAGGAYEIPNFDPNLAPD